MNNQLSIGIPAQPQRVPVMPAPSARHTDPATSHEAAENAKERAATHRALVLKALRICPRPLTYRELTREIGRRWPEQARNAGLVGDAAPMAVMRRLGDLKKAEVVEHGDARFCSVGGTRMVTWILVDSRETVSGC